MTAYCSTPAVLTLTLGSTVLDLMDQANGFRIGEVDLGYPDVREDINLRPDQHGVADFTQFFGARAVTISGAIVPSSTGSRQKALQALAPFLNPAARPVLTYQIDGDVGPRTLTLRPSDLSVPVTNPQVSDFQVGWKAADPFAYDANVQTAIVWVTVAGGGRQYNLVFPRVYPPGGVSQARTYNLGSFDVYPTLTFYGPMTGIQVTWTALSTPTITGYFLFQPSYTIPAGSFVVVDCKNRTAFLNGDPANSVYSRLGYLSSGFWPYIPAGGSTIWSLSANNTSAASQVQIRWQDAYLL
jgi:Phage tail protein